MVEVKQHDQYVIHVDGSGRVTLRNRKFLQRFSLYEPSIHCPVPVTYQHTKEPSKGPMSSNMTPTLRHPSPPPQLTEPAINSPPRPISTGSSESTVSPRCQSPTTPIVLNPPLVELQPSGDNASTESPASTSPTSNQAPSTAPQSFTPRRSKRATHPTKRYIEQCDKIASQTKHQRYPVKCWQPLTDGLFFVSGLLNCHLTATVVYLDFASNVYKQCCFV